MAKEFPDTRRFLNLPVADVVVEAKQRLDELRCMRSEPQLTESEITALDRAISELKAMIRRNVC